MRFRKKLVVSYFLFMLLVSAVLGIFYHTYSRNRQKQTEAQNMELLARHMLQNTNITLAAMENVMNYFLSDPEIITALKTLSDSGTDNPKTASRRREATATIQSKLATDYIIRHFYRVIYFNESGDSISSNNFDHTLLNPASTAGEYPYLDQITGTKGSPVFLANHTDYWGLKENPPVVSLVKELQGNHMGYLEVQLLSSEIEQLYQTDRNETDIVAFYQDHVLFAGSGAHTEQAHDYLSLTPSDSSIAVTAENPVTGAKERIYRYSSPDSPLSLLIIEPAGTFQQDFYSTLLMAFLLAGSFLLISIIFVITISHYVTTPLLQLKQLIDRTEIGNLRTLPSIRSHDDEISEVAESYRNLLVRLDRSITREKQLSLLQLQSQFDLLQTQINPHFLYNVLNLLISRGVENEDDMTCEICGSLASMLRYSLNTRERYAPIAEETAYLEQYFFLLKCRYRQKLEYEIHVDASVASEPVPKTILQQFVENSVQHGYEHSETVMHITVSGWRSEDYWNIRIRDNGCGFSSESLRSLEERFRDIRRQLKDSAGPIESAIGGMGLTNAYARLFLIYGEQLIFRIQNLAPGAEVFIGAPHADAPPQSCSSDCRIIM